MKKYLIAVSCVLTCVLLLSPIESLAYSEYTACTVSCALNFRKNPSRTSVRLGIIYPGEIIYDCGIDENVLNGDVEFELIYRPSTNQNGYCEHHYLDFNISKYKK